jgi:2'-5' RNA ligase
VSSDRIRSFISVDLDEPAIREKLIAVQKDLSLTGADLKFVDSNILHFTLRFLGEITQAAVAGVKEIMDGLRFERFDVTLSGLGAFPNLRRINVIWAGLTTGQTQLEEIFRSLEPKIRQLGIPADNRGFNPHLTIARVKSALKREALAEFITKHEGLELGRMSVTTLRLKKSTLTPRGPVYETMHEVSGN